MAMEIIAGFSWWQNMLLVVVGLFVLVSILALPRAIFKLVGRVLINCAGAAVVLLLINLTTSYSGVMLPLNGITVGVGGLLGAPGVVALGLAAYVI